ncbi:hypothetical protein FRB99_007827 [Tulasnella sp. 403]|nr:hypothetical protein FRB99_007827 [Tulasnella sp. 403]
MVTTRSSNATGKSSSGSKTQRNNAPKVPSPRKRVRQEVVVDNTPESGDEDDATSLRYFAMIPVEIFLQICEDLALEDLRNLCLISRRFRHALTSKNSRRYWHASLAKIPDLPACPPDLNEMQYAYLLYGTECYKCDKAGSKMHFFFRVRYCATCYKKNVFTDTAIKGLIPHSRNIVHISSCPRPLTRGVSPPLYRHHYPTTEALVKGYLALPWDDNGESVAARDKFWNECDARRVMLRRTAYEILNWVNYSVNSPWTGAANRRNARIKAVQTRLFRLGWSYLDMPNDTAFRNLMGDGPPLTDEGRDSFHSSMSTDSRLGSNTVWEDLRQKLEPTLHVRRDKRLALLERSQKQNRLSQRRWNLLCFYHDLIRQCVGDIWGLDSYKWLSNGDFYRIPAVATLLEDDTPQVTEEQFAPIREDVEEVFYERAAECMEHLTSIMQSTQEPRSSSHEQADPTQTTRVRVHAIMKRLSQATSAFWCESCKVVCWFPSVPRFHPPQGKGSHKLRPLHGSRLCPADQPDLVSRVLESAELSSEFTLAENHMNQLGRFLCLRCDERVAQYRTFNELIAHFLKAREWYLDATAATQADPKRAYRWLGGDLSRLPTIIDHHDWTTDAPLARLDDLKMQQEVDAAHLAFVNSCRKDPEDDPTGRGGEHLSRDYDNLAIKRTCKLCPLGFSPMSTSSARIRIHIRLQHGKEADLDADTITHPMRQPVLQRPAIMG